LEKGTMIRDKPERIGKRLNIIVLGHVDNDQISKFIAILDKYNIKSKILFNHYGRPTKCKRELDKWFGEYNSKSDFINKLERTDEDLEQSLKIIKDKMKRADDLLFKTTK